MNKGPENPAPEEQPLEGEVLIFPASETTSDPTFLDDLMRFQYGDSEESHAAFNRLAERSEEN